jgi:hypothetical protein
MPLIHFRGHTDLDRMPPEIDGADGVRMHTQVLGYALRAVLPIQAQPSFNLGYVAFDQLGLVAS